MAVPTSDVQLLPAGDRPDIVVDLSNVCRDDRLGGDRPSWARYVTVLEAWRTEHGRLPRGVAVADANLRSILSNADVQAFDGDVHRGVLWVARDVADVEILAYARETGARVVSRDAFRDYRDVHPWIQGDNSNFVGWKRQRDRIVLFTRSMRTRSPFTVSEGQEAARIKSARLNPSLDRDRSLLQHVYRCENGSCSLARRFPNHLEEPPSMRSGVPACPECRMRVVDLGPRADLAELVVEIGTTELRRVSLRRGEDFVLGRRQLEAAAKRRKVANGIDRISREHVRLAVDDAGEVIVTDLGSRNGTGIATWNQIDEGWSPARSLGAEVPMTLGGRHAALLAGVVRVRLSGQRFPLAEPGKPIVIGDVDLKVTRPSEEDDGA